MAAEVALTEAASAAAECEGSVDTLHTWLAVQLPQVRCAAVLAFLLGVGGWPTHAHTHTHTDS